MSDSSLSSRLWINPDQRSHRKKSARKQMHTRKRPARGKRMKSAATPRKRAGKSRSAAARQSSAQTSGSFLDQLASLAGHVDLPKVRHTLSEMNQVMEQMNELLRKFPRPQPPRAEYRPSREHVHRPPYQHAYPFHPLPPSTMNVNHLPEHFSLNRRQF